MFFLKSQFLKAATERAVKTAAQVVATAYLVGDVAFNVVSADWVEMGGLAAGGAFASYVLSFASGFVGESDTPSLGGETLSDRRDLEVIDPGPDDEGDDGVTHTH